MTQPISKLLTQNCGHVSSFFKKVLTKNDLLALSTQELAIKVFPQLTRMTEKEQMNFISRSFSKIERNDRAQGSLEKTRGNAFWRKHPIIAPFRKFPLVDKQIAIEEVYKTLLSAQEPIQLVARGSDNNLENTLLMMKLAIAGKDTSMIATDINPQALDVANIIYSLAKTSILEELGISIGEAQFEIEDAFNFNETSIILNDSSKINVDLSQRLGIVVNEKMITKFLSRILKSDLSSVTFLKDSETTEKTFTEKFQATKRRSEVVDGAFALENNMLSYVSFDEESLISLIEKVGGKVIGNPETISNHDDYGNPVEMMNVQIISPTFRL